MQRLYVMYITHFFISRFNLQFFSLDYFLDTVLYIRVLIKEV